MEDLANYPGLTRRNNTWYARKKVPVDVKDMYKSDSVKRSLKTENLTEAKKQYLVQMMEFESDFDQKRKEQKHKQDLDQLSKFSEAALLGLVFEWFNDGNKKSTPHNSKTYTDEEIRDAYINLQVERQEYQDALKTNDYTVIYPTAHRWLEKKQITYDYDAPAFHKLCTYLIKAYLFIYEKEIKEEYEGKIIAHETPPFLKSVAHQNFITLDNDKEPILLTDLLERFLKQPTRKDMAEKSNNDYRLIIRRLNEYAEKELYIHEITPTYLEKYAIALLKYPPRAHKDKRFTNKSFIETVKLNEKLNGSVLTPKTYNRHIVTLKALFDYAKDQDFILKNPVRKLTVKDDVPEEEKRNPWPFDYLQRIFEMPLFLKHNPNQFTRSKYDKALYWVCLIALHAGLRREEICQLYIEDIKTENGINYFHINIGEGEDKKLKTKSSTRKVPIHYDLIEMGFFSFVNNRKNKNNVRLFPELIKTSKDNGKGHGLGRRFYELRKKHDILVNKCSFHSFRHNYKDALMDAEIERSIALALGGWSDGNKKTVFDSYGKGYSLEKLNENLQKIQYPYLDFSHLYREEATDGHNDIGQKVLQA